MKVIAVEDLGTSRTICNVQRREGQVVRQELLGVTA